VSVGRCLSSLIVLPALTVGPAVAAHFTDIFADDPSALGRCPFTWSISPPDHRAATAWDLVNGALEYRTQDSRLREASVFMWDAGVEVTDDTTWSLEVGFRHVSGTPATPQHEAVVYAGWPADVPGQYSLLALVYDAARAELTLLNGGGKEAPIACDLTGDFHLIRLTVRGRQVRVYVEGKLRSGPHPVGSLACESPAWFILGPITAGGSSTFRCQWRHFAFTDEGAFAPDGRPGWDPSRERKPVAAAPVPGSPMADPAAAFDHPPCPNIRVLGREPGRERYDAASPEYVSRWNEIGAARPAKIEVPDYRYPDEAGPSRQNVYRFTIPLRLDDRRLVAMMLLTRGIDDTIAGFMDYKLWYCMSLDGGLTYDQERPLVQRGVGFSATHPIEQVWIGKNSFVFATLPPTLLRMSNGEVFLPCYYAPLDENGGYYNPRGTSTYSLVCGLIGTWNEAGTDLLWDVTAPITVTPAQSTGGLSECGVIELAGRPGRLFMAMRGGNELDRTGRVPCWKWKTLSTDYGRTWSRPKPLTFSDGTAFYSPTSQCSLVRSSRTGKAYWLGNISRVRPRGGWPRYPLAIAELDEARLGLRRNTVTIIDDRGPEDASDMQLSNFACQEEAATGRLLVTLNRLRGGPGADGPVTYVLEVR